MARNPELYESAGKTRKAAGVPARKQPYQQCVEFCRQDNEGSRRACFEAATLLSCLAEADQGLGFREKLMTAVPVLVAHLSGGLGVATAEQSASALGVTPPPSHRPPFSHGFKLTRNGEYVWRVGR